MLAADWLDSRYPPANVDTGKDWDCPIHSQEKLEKGRIDTADLVFVFENSLVE
jgi:hypothetical protein